MAADTGHIADYLELHKEEILDRWRSAAENEPAQAERLAKMDDNELLDHLPALTEALIRVLRGEEESLVEHDARRHGHQRRLDGYSVVDVLWELTIFRRVFLAVLDEASEAVADWIPVDGSNTILNLLDLCARASIEQHVKETEQERDAAASRAGALETQRERFLGTLSHELRNQIQPILLGLQRLKDSDPTDQQLRALEMIDRQTRQQSFLIENLLDLNRKEIGKIELRRSLVDLRECVRHAAETNQAEVGLKSLKVRLDLPTEPIYALVDRARLCQVANNLMSNAVRFTPKEGTIVWRLYQEPGWQVVSIRDSGVGIKPDDLSHIFETFFQGDVPADVNRGGLGVGLPVAKHLVELHGGQIEGHSEGLGEGSEFIVRIPIPSESENPPAADGPAHSAASSPSPTPTQDFVHHRVLIVDDNIDGANVLAELLELWGHEAAVAYEARAALELARSFLPDVVLLDLGLPGMDGLSVARKLRQLPHGERLRLIAMTGHAGTEDREASSKAGCDAHLVKPVDSAVLQSLLGAWKDNDRAD